MLSRCLTVMTIGSLLVLPAGVGNAASQPAAAQKQTQEQIYGSQLMTHQERLEHRAKLRSAKTVEEREQIRREHHERMQLRAKERGVSLPDTPPMRGGGMMGPGGPKR